jgi:RNA polymerase sigma-70 factor (family 1)
MARWIRVSAEQEGKGWSGASDLLDRLASGEVDALDEVLDRNWDAVVNYAASTVGCFDSAEDLAQEAFIALWEGRNQWGPETRLRPLLLRMVRNRSLNEIRFQEVRYRLQAKVQQIDAARRPPDPSECLDERELEEAFRNAFRALSPRKREVFGLARFQALSYPEIAAILGTSPQTVANQMSAALGELRRALHPAQSG